MNKKIVIIALSVVLALVVISAGIFAAVSSQNKEPEEGTTSAPIDNSSNQGEQLNGNEGTGDSSSEGAEGEGTPDAQTDISKLIIGTWRDSADMSGYAFYEDGSVEMTYVNLTIPVLNWPINGTSKGVYTLEGDKLTTTFSIYSASIINTYTVKVENNTLTMYDHEEFETATYQKVSSSAPSQNGDNTQNSGEIADGTDLAGSWTNGDGTEKYVFNADSTASVTKNGVVCAGVYLTDGDKITLQYTLNSEKITEKYTYTVSSNNLILTSGADMTILVRSGTADIHDGSTEDLLGIWRDGANMSGYEFKDGGVVDITYVNFTVPVINMPINGTYTGSYTVDGDSITISYSIYGNSITETYTYTVSNNALTLKNADSEVSTYIKQ